MANAEPEDIKFWLEWAGARMLLLPFTSGPARLHSSWPGVVPQRRTIAFNLAAQEFTILDEVSTLPNLIREPPVRRIVQSRSLIKPTSGHNLYQWSKIADLVGVERRTVQRWFNQGLEEICVRVEPEVVERMQPFFARASRLP